MSVDGNPSSQVSNEEISLQIANLIRNGLNFQTQNPKQNLSDNLKINLNLNSQNYALWARMIKVAIGGKSKALLSHLTTNPPEPTADNYDQWEQEDLVIFSWIIQNIEPSIASNLTEFPTAKSLWDALVVTYSSGKDKLQTFDLHVKANEIKQNEMSLEDLWIIMQGIWGEIDRRDPNPMKCAIDIATYNKARTEQKLFQFLNAIDHRYDSIKREIMRGDPLPTPEGAYAAVRKETAHQSILTGNTNEGNGLTVTGLNENDGAGFIARNQRRTDRGQSSGSFSRIDKSKLKCDHCGMMKHTKEQCFKIVGYPEWWKEGNKKGKAATAVGNPEVTSSGGNQSRKNHCDDGFGGSAFGFMTTAKSTDDYYRSNNGDNKYHRTSEIRAETNGSPFDLSAETKEEEGGGEEKERENEIGHQDGNDYWAWH